MTRTAIVVASLLWSVPTAGPAFAQAATTAGQASAPAPAEERLAEVRVHGNHTTPDDDVLRIAGLTVGQPIDRRRH